jgi:hypothetical protein
MEPAWRIFSHYFCRTGPKCFNERSEIKKGWEIDWMENTIDMKKHWDSVVKEWARNNFPFCCLVTTGSTAGYSHSTPYRGWDGTSSD